MSRVFDSRVKGYRCAPHCKLNGRAEDELEFIDLLSMEFLALAYRVHGMLSTVSDCRRISVFW